MSIELVIKIKDDTTIITEKHLLYEPITLSRDDKSLMQLVNECINRMTPKPADPDIIIKATLLL